MLSWFLDSNRLSVREPPKITNYMPGIATVAFLLVGVEPRLFCDMFFWSTHVVDNQDLTRLGRRVAIIWPKFCCDVFPLFASCLLSPLWSCPHFLWTLSYAPNAIIYTVVQATPPLVTTCKRHSRFMARPHIVKCVSLLSVLSSDQNLCRHNLSAVCPLIYLKWKSYTNDILIVFGGPTHNL